MALRIKLKNSVVQDRTPTTSDLPEVGELAVNANINSIGGFMRASDNTIVKIFGPGSLSTPTATTTVSGISELATNSETTTGTATNRVVTPAGLNAVTVAERTTSNSTYLALAGGTLTGVLAATAGSNSAPSIHFGDSDSGVFGGTNSVSLAAGGTTRLTADTGVSVVGTLAVTGAITSTSDLTIADKIIHAGDTNTAIRFPAADTVSIETDNDEALRVDSSQRLLAGHTSSLNVASNTGALLQLSRTSNDVHQSLNLFKADNLGSILAFGKSRAASIGTFTVVQNNDELGVIRFAGADGTDLQSQAASIAAFVDGTPGANDMPGRLVFSTTADGAASPTERLTIDNAGLVKLPDNGKLVAGAGSDLQIYHDGTDSKIVNSTGSLDINGSGNVNIGKAGENGVKVKPDNAVELYYNNVKKLETKVQGVIVSNQGSNRVLDVHHTDGNSAYISFQDSTTTDNGTVRLGAEGNEMKFFSGGSETMRLGTTGELMIGDSSQINSGFLNLKFSGTTHNGIVLKTTRSQTGTDFIQFRNSDGDLAGEITHNGTTTVLYTTSSDYRLKENATAISDAITRLKTLKPYRFNFKSEPDKTVDGFFAHEVTAVPEAVAGEKDSVDKDGNIDPQQLDQSKLVPLLVAAVQELTGKVEALEAA